MRLSILFSLCFFLFVQGGSAQSGDAAFHGRYVGQYTFESGHAVIKLKKNHRYTIKRYNWAGTCTASTTGSWTKENDKIVLKNSSGKDVILQKHQGPWTNKAMAEKTGWYIYGANGFSFDGYFYQGMSAKEFKKMRATNGC